MALRAGRLTKIVRVYRVTQVQDGDGGFFPLRELIKRTYASIQPVKGKDEFEGDKVINNRTVKIIMHYFCLPEEITPDHEIEWKDPRTLANHVYNIFDPRNIETEARRYEIMAVEQVT